jgi:hypothetical protein
MQVMASPQPIASARLDQVPDPGAYLRLPDWWGQRFMLFCDTEEEFDWAQPRSRDNRATTHMKAMPETHRRLHDLGAHSVYLVDDPIVCDGAAVEMLGAWAERGECAIGTQLHPWVNPPFDEEVNTPNSFVGNLPAALEQAKIEALTHAIEAGSALGPSPTARAATGSGRTLPTSFSTSATGWTSPCGRGSNIRGKGARISRTSCRCLTGLARRAACWRCRFPQPISVRSAGWGRSSSRASPISGGARSPNQGSSTACR